MWLTIAITSLCVLDQFVSIISICPLRKRWEATQCTDVLSHFCGVRVESEGSLYRLLFVVPFVEVPSVRYFRPHRLASVLLVGTYESLPPPLRFQDTFIFTNFIKLFVCDASSLAPGMNATCCSTSSPILSTSVLQATLFFTHRAPHSKGRFAGQFFH